MLSFLRINSAGYDAGEYLKTTQLTATLDLVTDCLPATVKDINAQAVTLQIYSAGIPGNKLIVLIENQIIKTTSELVSHAQPVSPAYCADKLAILRRETQSLQQLQGAKSR